MLEATEIWFWRRMQHCPNMEQVKESTGISTTNPLHLKSMKSLKGKKKMNINTAWSQMPQCHDINQGKHGH